MFSKRVRICLQASSWRNSPMYDAILCMRVGIRMTWSYNRVLMELLWGEVVILLNLDVWFHHGRSSLGFNMWFFHSYILAIEIDSSFVSKYKYKYKRLIIVIWWQTELNFVEDYLCVEVALFSLYQCQNVVFT